MYEGLSGGHVSSSSSHAENIEDFMTGPYRERRMFGKKTP
jgi:hypothetical protein